MSFNTTAPRAQDDRAQLLREQLALFLHWPTSRDELDQIEPLWFENAAERALLRVQQGLHELRPDYTHKDVNAEFQRLIEAEQDADEKHVLHTAHWQLNTTYKDEPHEQKPASRAKEIRHQLRRTFEKPKAPRRERRTEATPDEIKRTAEAVEVEANAATFSELRADQIPAPALLTGDKPEYDPHQLRVLLYPSLTCVSLQTETGHAQRAAHHIGDDVLYCPELGFLHFEKQRGFWQQDDLKASLTAAKLAALAPIVRIEAATKMLFAAALAGAGRDTDARAMSRAANSHLSHAKQVETSAFLKGAATFLSAIRRTEVAQFAPHPWKFAFKNVVFDCGQWRPARRDDFLLHVSPVEMNNRADRREWCALLNRITGGDEDFARTLQDVCAYALSGAATLRVLPWLYGPAGTGKSTICELLQTLLGESAATVDPAHLTDRAQREKLGAVICFKLAAFVTEAGNQWLSAELLKTLSGGDRISVCFKYKEAFTAKPTHALILAANDAPKTDAYDEALKDRVLALPFAHRLDDGEPLEFEGHTRLEAARVDPESPLLRGFAAWVAEGLERLHQTQEIYRAPAVNTATAQFWADTDELTPFWESIGEEQLRAGVAAGELRQRYEAWCDAEKMRPLKGRNWARACESRQLKQEQRGKDRTRFWFFCAKKPQK